VERGTHQGLPHVIRMTLHMKVKGRFFVLTAVFFAFSITVSSQSVSGVPGYVRIPIASFYEDGSFLFGSSFMPHQHLSYTNNNYDALAVFVNLTFLSFVEVDLRVTRQLNLPSGYSHVVDRVPTIRFRILKEQKWIPAVTLGFHDVLTSIESGSARHFGASYLVATKNFHLKKLHLEIGATTGYGAGSFIWKNDEFIGLFGGLSLTCDQAKWINLLFDYDGATFNTGLRLVCFSHLYITAATLNFDSFTGTLCYRFKLIR
jgi:hypothetical protein